MPRRIFWIAALAALILLCAGTAVSMAADSLVAPPAKFMTPKFRKEVRHAGSKGKKPPKSDGPGPLDVCPGIDPNSPSPATSVVSAGTCEVYPYGCTANFIYSGSGQYYIGVAGHCVDHGGQDVYMQVNSPGVGPSIADVGTVWKAVNGGIGNDYAVIAIKPGFTVDPKDPVGGPQGVYTGCGPETVRNWSHGYAVAMGQGRPEGGLATNWYDDGYGWTGVGLPGSSGSGMVTSSSQAAGDLTHLIVNWPGYPGSDLAGTRMTKILARTGLSLVNADGTLSRETTTNCGSQPPSAKGGGGGGGLL